jgi:hypothetical protein
VRAGPRLRTQKRSVSVDDSEADNQRHGIAKSALPSGVADDDDVIRQGGEDLGYVLP